LEYNLSIAFPRGITRSRSKLKDAFWDKIFDAPQSKPTK
jgi:hypothetical protein